MLALVLHNVPWRSVLYMAMWVDQGHKIWLRTSKRWKQSVTMAYKINLCKYFCGRHICLLMRLATIWTLYHLIIHPHLHNVTPSLIFWNHVEWLFSILISLLIVIFSSYISLILTLNEITVEFRPHAHTHHGVIIMIIVIIAGWRYVIHKVTCYTEPFSFYHTSMSNTTL